MRTITEEDKTELTSDMNDFIDEYRLFQSLCTGRVHDDDRGITWLTWCIRNKEIVDEV